MNDMNRSAAAVVALALTRAWTRLYTYRMPQEAREARRAEIDSDLWEWEQDLRATGRGVDAAHAVARLLGGVADDLSWRLEQTSAPRVAVWSMTAASLGAVCALSLLVWSGDPGMPPPPAAPALSMAALMEAPPPPPPPPPRRLPDVPPPPPPPPRPFR